MGVPTKIKKEFSINALPIRAYVKIWNEFFRDENVDNTAVLRTDDANVDYEFGREDWVQEAENNAYKGGNLLPVNKFHDYFTSCLPYPQRGPAVPIPMTGNAPVRLGDESGTYVDFAGPVEMVVGAGQNQNTPGSLAYNNATGKPKEKKQITFTGVERTSGEVGTGGWMYTDLSTVTAATVNDLRKAVAVQQYYEALARGGSRYREQVQALWNVTISDKTVQIPEYLGGVVS